MSQRRKRMTRLRAFSSDNIEVVDARREERRKGGFGEIPEWNPAALRTGSKVQSAVNKAYYYTPEPVRSSLKFPSTWNDWKTSLLIWIPILQWSWTYRAKDLIGDLVAGFTIGMTHIPQGKIMWTFICTHQAIEDLLACLTFKLLWVHMHGGSWPYCYSLSIVTL